MRMKQRKRIPLPRKKTILMRKKTILMRKMLPVRMKKTPRLKGNPKKLHLRGEKFIVTLSFSPATKSMTTFR